jgi:AraC-like DNA-binding protein
MNTDLVSSLLDLLRARSALSGGLLADGAWAIRFPATDQLKFWGIRRGAAWLVFEDQAPIRVEAGDVLLFRAPRPHLLASDPAVPAVPLQDIVAGRGGAIVHAGDGEDFLMLGGKVELEEGCEPLLFTGLPEMLHLAGGSAQVQPVHWVLERLVQERDAMAPGWELACTQLAHLMFIAILRICMQERELLGSGWLRAASDERLAPALRLMHGDPGRAWTLPVLASAAAMSRAGFAERFKAAAGTSPLSYLTELRMRLAQQRLRRGDATVARLAEAYGYASESAFSHAFKRVMGLSPRHFRNRLRDGGAS